MAQQQQQQRRQSDGEQGQPEQYRAGGR